MVLLNIGGFREFLSSLFPEPETFIRELIQNSMEALHAAARISGESRNLGIDIKVDTGTPTITIRDNGCGMTRQELSENLATVFRSGWRNGDYDALGVGQFGFGFFSTMLVADLVEVRTRSISGDGESTLWRFDCKSGATDMFDPKRPLESSGFEVTLHLSDEFRHFASSSHIIETLKEYLLFCPFAIHVAGAQLDLPTRAQWQRMLSDPRSICDVIEDAQRAFSWEEAPLAVRASDDGILVVTPPAEQSAPATKIYRHGVFVLETEIIPQPLNYIFCGIFNVDALNIRPDRKSFIDDSAAEAFRGRILEQVVLLFRELSREPRQSVPFFEGWLEPMIASVMFHNALEELRPEMPLRLVGSRGITLALETNWKKLSQKLSGDRVLFTRDPVADRAMIDFFRGTGETIVALMNAGEYALARYCARASDIRLVAISDGYLERQKREAEDHCGLTTLFSEARSGRTYEFICVRESDARIPLKLLRENSEHDTVKDLLMMLAAVVGKEPPKEIPGEDRWIGIINLSHPAIDVLSKGLETGTSRSRLRNGAELLLLSARLGSGEEISSEEQIAHATALGNLMADAFAMKCSDRHLPFSRPKKQI